MYAKAVKLMQCKKTVQLYFKEVYEIERMNRSV